MENVRTFDMLKNTYKKIKFEKVVYLILLCLYNIEIGNVKTIKFLSGIAETRLLCIRCYEK